MMGNARKISHRQDDLASLMELVAMMTSGMSLEHILSEATSRTKDMMNVDACTIRLIEGKYLSMGAASGYGQTNRRHHRIKIDKLLSDCLTRCEPIVLEDMETAAHIATTWKSRASTEQFRSYLGVPMAAGGRSIGILSLYSRTPHKWTQRKIELATTVANSIAVVIENVRLLQDIKESAERYRELAKIGQLTTALAHEVKNPLAAMSTVVDVLKQVQGLSGEDKELFQIIVDEVDRIKIIIDDFIRYARPAPLRLIKSDVNKLARETVQLLESQAPANVRTKLSLETKLPKVRLDTNQIRQVLINLILNAFDAMPDGGSVECSTASVLEENNGAAVKISVTDTGIGLTTEVRTHLFEPFFSTKDKGSGLGLAISKQIVENHSGKIIIENGVNMGTTFSIFLPDEK